MFGPLLGGGGQHIFIHLTELLTGYGLSLMYVCIFYWQMCKHIILHYTKLYFV